MKLMTLERCNEIIDSVAETEERYLTQLASYKERLQAANEKQALNPKQKVKQPKEPFAPQHAYTSLARAHTHKRAHKLIALLEANDVADDKRYAAMQELTKLGFFDPVKFLVDNFDYALTAQ